MRLTGRKPALAMAFVTGYFLWMAGPGLATGFSDDDMMNLYQAWTRPLGGLLTANLDFTTAYHRPVGGLWYRAVYSLSGFHPLPFHAVNFCLLLLNAGLAYLAARRLSGSWETGAVTALLVSYHPRFYGLYHDTGNIFDVLCFFFYFSGFVVYLREREAGGEPRPAGVAAVTVLYLCALNSKEMAVTFPLALLAYELFYRRPASWRGWLLRDGRAVLVTGLLTVIFVAAKVLGPDPMARIPAYRPVFTAGRFLAATGEQMDTFLYQWGAFSPALIAALWLGTGAAAWAARSRILKFAWCFLLFSPLPVSFLEHRVGPSLYIPLFGWSVYAAAVAVGTMSRLRVPALALPLVALACLPRHTFERSFAAPAYARTTQPVLAVAEGMRTLYPELPRGARVLFLNDPYLPEQWNMHFILRLLYRDASIQVDRMKTLGRRPDEAGYSAVIDCRDGRLCRAAAPR